MGVADLEEAVVAGEHGEVVACVRSLILLDNKFHANTMAIGIATPVEV